MEQNWLQIILGVFVLLVVAMCCCIVGVAFRMKYLYDLRIERERRFFVDIRTIPSGVVIHAPVQIVAREDTITRNPLDMV